MSAFRTFPTFDRGRSPQISTCLGAFTLPMRPFTKVVISGASAYFGTVLAPDADFTSSGASGMYGAATAKTLTLSSGSGWLHHDTSLNGGGVGGFTVQMERGW